jgi:hypothetical protein
MNVNVYRKGDYVEFFALKVVEKQSQSKPILNGVRWILLITQEIAMALRVSH